ncbi:Crp/Fnr family transcriptional regulator [Verrucomicrobiota bacterium]
MKQDIINHHLAAASLFKGLSSESREKLASLCYGEKIAKKDLLFFEGERGSAFFQLVSGRIQLHKTNEDGKETVIRLIRPGDIFAEVILFEQDVYPVTAVAIENSEVIRLPKRDTLALLNEEHFRNEFIADLLQKQRYLTQQIQRLATYDIEERFFLFLRDHYGKTHTVKSGLSKKDIAAAIGATPESLSRLILRLQKREVLDWKGKEIKIAPGFWDDFNLET